MTNPNFISFSINGTEYKVKSWDESSEMSSDSKLVDFIRDKAKLKGTKYLCREGGCGACVVSATIKDPISGQLSTKSINSCLTPVLSCDGWDISTVEDLGDRVKGYHPLQKRLAQFAGTQCGFCTPGMIMTMHSLMEQKKSTLKMEEVEEVLDGNICRCTGYRSILDAFKSFASDAPLELKQKCLDIEDCLQCPCPPLKKSNCCKSSSASKAFPLPSDLKVVELEEGKKWIKVNSLQSLYQNIQLVSKNNLSYRFVAGNTAIGIFKQDIEKANPNIFFDIKTVPELLRASYNASGIVLGAALSISEAVETLQSAAKFHEDFSYVKIISNHFTERVGNIHIRNVATLGGNLMLKHDHPSFVSDVWLLFEAVGATLTLGCSLSHRIRTFTMAEFLKKDDLSGKVILSIELPPISQEVTLRSFKISPRYQNSKGYLNAAFLFRVIKAQNFRVFQKPIIIFGGVGPNFNHATQTEEFLNGKSLVDNSTLQSAFALLEKELEIPPETNILTGSPAYRKGLAKSLLYKTILGIAGATFQKKNVSGGQVLQRGLQKGKQIYLKVQDKETNAILYKGFPKLEAIVQCSGEAEYTNDIPQTDGELFGAFVLSSVGNATLKSVEAEKALAIPGVFGFIQAKDIPGPNNYMVWEKTPEEIFVSSKIHHAGQPIGLILAKSREIAFQAVKKVSISYEDIRKPILSIEDSLEKARQEGTLDSLIVSQSKSKQNSGLVAKHVIKGQFKVGSQAHFQMEPHSTICIPKEDGLQVYSATQWIDKTQALIASCLKVPVNNINVQVRRLGGGFGGKATRSGQIAAACAVAAHVSNRPVRLTLDLETHLRMIGKRLPYLISYEVGFNDEGKIVRLDAKVYCDPGFTSNEETTFLYMMNIQNCYDADGWAILLGAALTNTPANTFCRAPGHTQGAATIEYIMSHIAFHLKKDPMEVRMANLIKKSSNLLTNPNLVFDYENPLGKMLQDFKKENDFEVRMDSLKEFNSNNRWMKRGLEIVPIRFPNHYIGGKYSVFVGIHHIDGSVIVSHGGIEMGQGIHTKVAQTVAQFLNIPLDKVKIKPTNNLVTPNSSLTAAGTTSESCCFAAVEACKILKERMREVEQELKIKDGSNSWEEVVTECHKRGIDLTALFMNESNKDGIKGYDIWSLIMTEVEVDILTGEFKIARLDFNIDATQSLNPEIDLGQIEGALVLGLGLWTTEKIQYDSVSGQILTHGTWDYKPPETKNIPEDFRVTMFSEPKPNKFGVLGSKGAGEASMCSAFCVLLALRQAITSARMDSGNDQWFQLDGPVTPEDVFKHSLTNESQFLI